MARQWRIEYPGALYHVLSRGNGRQDIFFSDRDRCQFLELLQEVVERFGIHICAYVLMGNHYHLLLRITEANLSKAMQWFGTAYTRRFHITNRTGGHLFQGRFKSLIVENAAYMLRLACYIHRNPLRAGLVERLADYPWSSYPFYAYNKRSPVWLTTDLIMGQFSGDNPQAAFRRMVQQYADEKGSVWEDIKHGLVYGSQGFLDQLKERFLRTQKKDAELPQHNSLLLDADPQKLAVQAATAFGVDLTSVRNAKRIASQDRDQRDMLIYYLWETGRLSNQKIASVLGLTYSNISRRVSLFKERISIDKKLNSAYTLVKSQIKV